MSDVIYLGFIVVMGLVVCEEAIGGIGRKFVQHWMGEDRRRLKERIRQEKAANAMLASQLKEAREALTAERARVDGLVQPPATSTNPCFRWN